MNTLDDQLQSELADAERESRRQQEHVEPNKEEQRNGWTAEALTDYLASRKAGWSLMVDVNSTQRQLARRPDVQNSRYNPHRWR